MRVGLSSRQRHSNHSQDVEKGLASSPMVQHSVEVHGGKKPHYLSLIHTVESRPLYRAVRESVQIGQQPRGPCNINRCNEWGTPRIPILSVVGGDVEGQGSVTNPRPTWSEETMANIREGKVKRVRYWVEEEQDKVDGQQNKTNKDSSHMGSNDNNETSIVIEDSRAQPVKRPRTGDSPLEDLESVGSGVGGVGQKEETIPDASLESVHTQQQQDPEDTCKEIILELVEVVSREDGRDIGVKDTDLGDREVVTGVLRQGPRGQEDPGKVPHPLVQPSDARDLSNRVPELPRVFRFDGTQEVRTGGPNGGGR